MRKHLCVVLVVVMLFVSQVACAIDSNGDGETNQSGGGLIVTLLCDQSEGQMCDQ
jgi:hypothetical protein